MKLFSERSHAYSVREITRMIKETLETEFPNIWIEGEISNFRKTAAGHAYFTLKDESAQISAVIFRSNAWKYLDDSIADGLKIRVYGNISVYEKSGNHEGGRNVLFLDCHAEWVQEERFKELIKKDNDYRRKKGLPVLPAQ